MRNESRGDGKQSREIIQETHQKSHLSLAYFLKLPKLPNLLSVNMRALVVTQIYTCIHNIIVAVFLVRPSPIPNK